MDWAKRGIIEAHPEQTDAAWDAYQAQRTRRLIILFMAGGIVAGALIALAVYVIRGGFYG